MLTGRQLIWALSPYRILPADLHSLMLTLSDPLEWEVFGDQKVGVLKMIMSAAANSGAIIPESFRRAYAPLTDPNLTVRF